MQTHASKFCSLNKVRVFLRQVSSINHKVLNVSCSTNIVEILFRLVKTKLKPSKV
jgi:hypothetical protein